MEDQTTPAPERTPFRRRIALALLVVLVVLVIVLALVVPRLADIDRYRPEVVAQIEKGSGRSATIGRLNLSVLPAIMIRADDVVIGNPADFPAGRFLAIHRAYLRLDAAELLHRRIVVQSLRLQDVKLNLISDPSGRWNTENPSPARALVRPAAWQRTRAPADVIASVSVEHGQVTAANMLPSGKPGAPSLEARDVSADLKDVNPEALGIHLAQIGDPDLSDGDDTRQARIRQPNLMNVAWTASVVQEFPQGLSATPPRGTLAAHGTLSADSARFGAIPATGIKSGVEIYANGLVVKGIVLQLFGGQVTGDLIWNPSLKPPSYTSQLTLSGINVERAVLAFPSARGKLTGTLDGGLQISGWTATGRAETPSDPLANLQGAGAVTIRNGTLPAIRLNRDLTLLMKNVVRTTAGSPDPSTFRSMSADFEIGDGEIRSRQIVILGNGINLSVSGSVAIAGAGKLDYRGTGEITARQSVGSLVAGLLGSKVGAGGKITFPFTLTGTLAAPRFDVPQSPFLH